MKNGPQIWNMNMGHPKTIFKLKMETITMVTEIITGIVKRLLEELCKATGPINLSLKDIVTIMVVVLREIETIEKTSLMKGMATKLNRRQETYPGQKRTPKNFNPCHDPPEARILFATPGMNHYDRPHYSRDVIVVRDLFIPPGVDPSTDLSIYNKLLEEIQQSGVNERLLWQSWHGDSHLIADDKRNWKKACPTFSWVVEKLADYFNMHVEATRLNWYRDSSEWKPFHHDAAALKPDKARTQNITVAVSFGAERDAAFEHAANRCVISMPQPNGTVYTFARDVNILWRHGIPQLPPSMQHNEGRISIICWGWCETIDV